MVMTDTCNTAQKLYHILVDKIPGAYDYDCMQHNCNVWINGMEKALTTKLNEMLRTDLDNIDEAYVSPLLLLQSYAPLT